jgi:hypothetical protein
MVRLRNVGSRSSMNFKRPEAKADLDGTIHLPESKLRETA